MEIKFAAEISSYTHRLYEDYFKSKKRYIINKKKHSLITKEGKCTVYDDFIFTEMELISDCIFNIHNEIKNSIEFFLNEEEKLNHLKKIYKNNTEEILKHSLYTPFYDLDQFLFTKKNETDIARKLKTLFITNNGLLYMDFNSVKPIDFDYDSEQGFEFFHNYFETGTKELSDFLKLLARKDLLTRIIKSYDRVPEYSFKKKYLLYFTSEEACEIFIEFVEIYGSKNMGKSVLNRLRKEMESKRINNLRMGKINVTEKNFLVVVNDILKSNYKELNGIRPSTDDNIPNILKMLLNQSNSNT